MTAEPRRPSWLKGVMARVEGVETKPHGGLAQRLAAVQETTTIPGMPAPPVSYDDDGTETKLCAELDYRKRVIAACDAAIAARRIERDNAKAAADAAFEASTAKILNTRMQAVMARNVSHAALQKRLEEAGFFDEVPVEPTP